MGRKNQEPESTGGANVGPWIVTFSDCMTLLLCFFVLLMTFSSFDEQAQSRFAGAFEVPFQQHSIDTARMSPKESFVPPPERQIDRTAAGSETPTDNRLERVENPAGRPVVPDTDAYAGRKDVFIPSTALFWGQGSAFDQRGRQTLGHLREFLQKAPCHVLIGEMPGAEDRTRDPAAVRRRGLDRARAVAACLTEDGAVAPGWINVSLPREPAPDRYGGRSVVRITLIARSVYE